MTLRMNLRALGALTLMLACAATTSAPAVAAGKSKHASKPKHASKQAVKKAATQPRLPVGLGSQLGLTATTQLAALTAGVTAAPSFYAGRSTGCSSVTPMLTAQPGSVIAGNFRDSDGACYVWLNLQQTELLTGSELCKIALHEYGHLTGLDHSADPNDVMFSPFRPDPIPIPCQA
jgi:hypothetical protein